MGGREGSFGLVLFFVCLASRSHSPPLLLGPFLGLAPLLLGAFLGLALLALALRALQAPCNTIQRKGNKNQNQNR